MWEEGLEARDISAECEVAVSYLHWTVGMGLVEFEVVLLDDGLAID